MNKVKRRATSAILAVLLLCSACSDGQGLGYAKTSLARRLATAQNQAREVLGKYERKKIQGQLGKELELDLRDEKIKDEEVTWILDLLGSGDEPGWFGQTQVTIRGCFKLYSPGGTKLITEQYDCGSTPSPGYPSRDLPEYKNTLKDCELDVCKPLASPTPTPELP